MKNNKKNKNICADDLIILQDDAKEIDKVYLVPSVQNAVANRIALIEQYTKGKAD